MAVLLSLATFLSTLSGGLVALRNRDRLHLLLGLTAGIILGVVAFDLLPEIFELSKLSVTGIPSVTLTFVAGFLALHVVEKATAVHHAHEDEYGEHRHPYIGLVSALALAGHSFMDGMAIGLGFQGGNSIGLAVALAVIGHDFADGLNTVGIMLGSGNTDRRSKLLLLTDAVAPVIGAASTLLFTVSDRMLGLYLGFFAGFLLYIATSDILPQAHSGHPSRWTIVCTFAGVAAMFAVVSAL